MSETSCGKWHKVSRENQLSGIVPLIAWRKTLDPSGAGVQCLFHGPSGPTDTPCSAACPKLLQGQSEMHRLRQNSAESHVPSRFLRSSRIAFRFSASSCLICSALKCEQPGLSKGTFPGALVVMACFLLLQKVFASGPCNAYRSCLRVNPTDCVLEHLGHHGAHLRSQLAGDSATCG